MLSHTLELPLLLSERGTRVRFPSTVTYESQFIVFVGEIIQRGLHAAVLTIKLFALAVILSENSYGKKFTLGT